MSVLVNIFLVLLASIPAVSCFSSSSLHSSKLLHQHQHTSKTTTTTQLHSSSFNLNFLDSLFSSTNSNNKSQIQQLKTQLYQTCQSSYGISTPPIRTSIESLISQLQPLNPTPSPSTSKLLQRKWIVLWTSEKEINFFLEKGISTRIEQTLSDGKVLENWIPFVRGGGFGVTGSIQPAVDNSGGSSDGLRTEFKFESATLDIGKWGTYNFPPLGEGWFDTVYLDDELRIDLNSRNDILICRGE
mmetsp:Transcript_27855/g.41872  ORF Transcript_27855/g.41872 Transcript_27855/m.41872 type:complete len:243 (+) Transcript_27855:320-1048(+)